MSPPVIVFGATGHVGSAAAIAAEQHGVSVVLALRDISKPIPGLSSEEEKARNFQRVSADLTKPETVEAAVRTTGAKHAFIYLIHGDTGYGKAAIEALKTAGIEFVVLLSTAMVQGDITKITPETYVRYAHAQYEIQLATIFGRGAYVALRPAFFNTNVRWWTAMIAEGEVRIPYPDTILDWLAPEDIGKAAATLLVQGPEALPSGVEGPETAITLCGPKLLSIRDAIGIFGKVLSRDIKITQIDATEGVYNLVKIGVVILKSNGLYASPDSAPVRMSTGKREEGGITPPGACSIPLIPELL
ncbi:uncharacterized protein B0I36DRAFT_425907 [Microdochium trichocladiopsis]|uniref:NmrA-like domain-containing protein n=1 Tax=Microdochium trichocladiopsis TaxID=1682393 RepID=A0A9P9BIS9_9PEZI|nr:uncharacterized protein B0I36DRAFT_425907 [Microdochium trichocladiopsis]KAH7014640.1 hypothetical protein B0I36DRAFT_425907 [Microdochium trichocladiopsis]